MIRWIKGAKISSRISTSRTIYRCYCNIYSCFTFAFNTDTSQVSSSLNFPHIYSNIYSHTHTHMEIYKVHPLYSLILERFQNTSMHRWKQKQKNKNADTNKWNIMSWISKFNHDYKYIYFLYILYSCTNRLLPDIECILDRKTWDYTQWQGELLQNTICVGTFLYGKWESNWFFFYIIFPFFFHVDYAIYSYYIALTLADILGFKSLRCARCARTSLYVALISSSYLYTYIYLYTI